MRRIAASPFLFSARREDSHWASNGQALPYRLGKGCRPFGSWQQGEEFPDLLVT